LFCLRWNSPSPFFHDAIFCNAPVLGLVLDSLRLGSYGALYLLDALREGEVLDKVEHGKLLDGREKGGIFKIGLIVIGAIGEGGRTREARCRKRLRVGGGDWLIE
jgi:hypothetical protein